MKVISKIHKIKTIALFFIFGCSAINVSAQYEPVKVGETVPDIVFNEVTGYSKNSLRLSDFKGKYVILDFWGHRCIPCLAAFPKIDSLQKEFKDNLQIIAVSVESSKETTDLFKRLKNLHKPNIPFINADTALEKMFPHFGVPFHIWLDREGRLMHAADAFNLQRDSLVKLISKGKLRLDKKNNPILIESFLDSRFKSNLGMASYIYKLGRDEFRLFPSDEHKGKYDIGDVANLYSTAFEGFTGSKFSLLKRGRVIVEAENPDRYKVRYNLSGQEFADWAAENAFVYQSIVPKDSKADLNKMMIEDLERYFNIYGTIEKRPVKMMVLVRTSTVDKLKTLGGSPMNNLTTSKNLRNANLPSAVRKLVNTDMSMLGVRLEAWLEKLSQLPFADGTNYKGKIDIVMDGETLDNLTLTSLKRALNEYDLDLREQDYITEVLVLRERK